ncbi:MAG: hypothetical protein KJN90_02450 [Gammaproteobacteria bacterium]|nr:hypothetical protein [Gammaproteobacteria bacterium]
MVFFAVAGALAADSWRAMLVENRESGQLINRLLADLNEGVDQLELDRDRTTTARDATARLTADFQHQESQRSEYEILNDFVAAARTGYYDFLLLHDATYRQLLNSGLLGNLVDTNTEVALIEYYQYIQLIKSLWASTPQTVNTKFHRATGLPPITVVDAGELAPQTRQQILDSLASDPVIEDDLRELHAMLSILILNDVFQRAIDSSHALSGRLEDLAG